MAITILSETPLERYDDDDGPPPMATMQLTKDPVSGEHVATALGLEARHVYQSQAIANLEQQLAAQPLAHERMLGADFRPLT